MTPTSCSSSARRPATRTASSIPSRSSRPWPRARRADARRRFVGGCVLPFLRDTGVPPPLSISPCRESRASRSICTSTASRRRASRCCSSASRAAPGAVFRVRELDRLRHRQLDDPRSKSVAALGAALASCRPRRIPRARRADVGGHAAARSRVEATPDSAWWTPRREPLCVHHREGDVFELADRLTELGWHVQPTYRSAPRPRTST